jgi:hypothetical protein
MFRMGHMGNIDTHDMSAPSQPWNAPFTAWASSAAWQRGRRSEKELMAK